MGMVFGRGCEELILADDEWDEKLLHGWDLLPISTLESLDDLRDSVSQNIYFVFIYFFILNCETL